MRTLTPPALLLIDVQQGIDVAEHWGGNRNNAGDLRLACTGVSDAEACSDKIGTDGSKFNSELIHQLSLSNLEGEYARILTTSPILALHQDHTLTRTE